MNPKADRPNRGDGGPRKPWWAIKTRAKKKREMSLVLKGMIKPRYEPCRYIKFREKGKKGRLPKVSTFTQQRPSIRKILGGFLGK